MSKVEDVIIVGSGPAGNSSSHPAINKANNRSFLIGFKVSVNCGICRIA